MFCTLSSRGVAETPRRVHLFSLAALWLAMSTSNSAGAQAAEASLTPAAEPVPAAEPAPTEAPPTHVSPTDSAPLPSVTETSAVLDAPPEEGEIKSPEGIVVEDEGTHGFDPKINYGVGLRNQTALITGDANGYTGALAGPVDHRGLVMNDINIRPYIYGQFHEKVAFEANLNAWAAVPELNAGVEILDAVFKFHIHDAFQIWVGRFLPPSDRANLSGPYFQNAWLYPLEMGYPPNIGSGRDNGLTFWGQLLDGMFRYQVGLFNLEGGNELRPAARLVLNVLNPESKTPFYYNSSSYYGTAGTILAFGVSGTYQKDGVTEDTDGDGKPDTVAGDYKAVQGDVLFELPIGKGGALDLEGAYYWYDSDDMRLMALASLLIPNTMIQPTVRLMVYPMGGDDDPNKAIDAGFNIIVDGHNLRFSVIERIDLNADDTAEFATIVGMQGQIWP